MSFLYKLDFKNAKQKFGSFLKNFKGLNYIKSANHKLAWIAFLQDNSEMKRQYFLRVLSEGDVSIDEDKVALNDAKKDYISHQLLLKTRLLYDGGYYNRALSEIENIDISLYYNNSENIIEYWYRLARIESKLNDSEKIIEYYKNALQKGKNSSSYYAPMSALQLGYIYFKKADYRQAKFYFNKCLAISGFDYQRGIHQKAKFALDKVED
jgi:tetratricopeptide (TPR) repeat protein